LFYIVLFGKNENQEILMAEPKQHVISPVDIGRGEAINYLYITFRRLPWLIKYP
jgi:hypothetical protein